MGRGHVALPRDMTHHTDASTPDYWQEITKDEADGPLPNSVRKSERSLAPMLLLQSKSERPKFWPEPKSVRNADRSFAPTPAAPSRSNAATVGEPMSVPFANTRPPFNSVVALPAPF